jgi:hypothetical protein
MSDKKSLNPEAPTFSFKPRVDAAPWTPPVATTTAAAPATKELVPAKEFIPGQGLVTPPPAVVVPSPPPAINFGSENNNVAEGPRPVDVRER